MFPVILKRLDAEPGTQEIPPDEPIVYIIGSNGAHMQKTHVAFRAVVPATKPLPMLDVVKQEAEYLLPPIPPELVMQALLFFRAIWDRQKSEAVLIISYNPRRGTFRFDAPPQRVTGAHASYDRPVRPAEGFIFVGTIHSHGSMSAFHSGTDTHDEEFFDGIHLTVGRIDRARFDIVSTLAVSGKRFPQEVTRVLGGVRLVSSEPARPLPPPEPIALPAESIVLPAESEEDVVVPPTIEMVTEFSGMENMKQSIHKGIAGFMIPKTRRPNDRRGGKGGGKKSRKGGYLLVTCYGQPVRVEPWPSKYLTTYTPYEPEGYVVDLPPDVDLLECSPPAHWCEQVQQPPPTSPHSYVDSSEDGLWRRRRGGDAYYDNWSDGEAEFWTAMPPLPQRRPPLESIIITSADPVAPEMVTPAGTAPVVEQASPPAAEPAGLIKVICNPVGRYIEESHEFPLAGRTIIEALRYLKTELQLPGDVLVFLNTVGTTETGRILEAGDRLHLFRNTHTMETALQAKTVSIPAPPEQSAEPVSDATSTARATSAPAVDGNPPSVVGEGYGVLLKVGIKEKRFSHLIGLTVTEVSHKLRNNLIFWNWIRLNGVEVKTWDETPRLKNGDHLIYFPNQAMFEALLACACCKPKEIAEGTVTVSTPALGAYESHYSLFPFVGKTVREVMDSLEAVWLLPWNPVPILNGEPVKSTVVLKADDHLKLYRNEDVAAAAIAAASVQDEKPV